MSESGDRGALSALMRTHVSPERRAALDPVEGLEALLREHHAAGQAQWPSVPLSPERFVKHLARHMPEGSGEALRSLHAADLYLACACSDGEPRGLHAFEQHILQRVPSRLGQLADFTVDDVLQELRQRLLVGRGDAPPRIADYSGRGPLLAWVRIIAARIVGELANQQGRQVLFDEPPEVLARMLASSDPERELLREDTRQALTEALRKALAVLSDKDRALLRLHHLHGLTMDRLSAMYGESRSGVARRVAQARERLMELTRKELASRLNLGGTEVESLLDLVQSRLDLSLQGLLG